MNLLLDRVLLNIGHPKTNSTDQSRAGPFAITHP